MHRYNDGKDYFDNLDNFYTPDEDSPPYSNDYEHRNYKSYTDSYAKTNNTSAEKENAKKSSSSNGVVYSSKMSDEERAALVQQLKNESQVQIDSFKSMVQDMF